MGGLTCIRVQVVAPGAEAEFSCTLAQRKRDDQAIYEALDVAEENITPPQLDGGLMFKKQAGSLICIKQTIITFPPAEEFKCSLD